MYSYVSSQFISHVFIPVYPLAPHIRRRALRGGPSDSSQVSVGPNIVFFTLLLNNSRHTGRCCTTCFGNVVVEDNWQSASPCISASTLEGSPKISSWAGKDPRSLAWNRNLFHHLASGDPKGVGQEGGVILFCPPSLQEECEKYWPHWPVECQMSFCCLEPGYSLTVDNVVV